MLKSCWCGWLLLSRKDLNLETWRRSFWDVGQWKFISSLLYAPRNAYKCWLKTASSKKKLNADDKHKKKIRFCAFCRQMIIETIVARWQRGRSKRKFCEKIYSWPSLITTRRINWFFIYSSLFRLLIFGSMFNAHHYFNFFARVFDAVIAKTMTMVDGFFRRERSEERNLRNLVNFWNAWWNRKKYIRKKRRRSSFKLIRVFKSFKEFKLIKINDKPFLHVPSNIGPINASAKFSSLCRDKISVLVIRKLLKDLDNYVLKCQTFNNCNRNLRFNLIKTKVYGLTVDMLSKYNSIFFSRMFRLSNCHCPHHPKINFSIAPLIAFQKLPFFLFLKFTQNWLKKEKKKELFTFFD